MKETVSNIKVWRQIAQYAAIFAFIISLLLIVNYAQYKRLDPVETELINTLVERLNDNPEDSQLREQIRTVDLLARKAYFTNQWQVRTGGYLLLLAIAIFVIAMQMIKSGSPKEVSFNEGEGSFLEQKNARKWISISGGILVSLAFIFAFLTHNDLAEKFSPKAEEIIVELVPEKAEVEKIEIDQTSNDDAKDKETAKKVLKSEDKVEVAIVTEVEKIEQAKKQSETNVVEPTEDNKVKVSDESNETVVTANSKYPTNEEILSNHNSFRGPGGNGISFRKNIPIKWDATTGENIVWKLEIPLHGYNSPIIWEDKIFLSGANSAKREVYCIDRNSGKILWTGELNNIPGSPAKSPEVTDDTGQAAPSLTTNGRSVFAIFANGDIIAFDMEGKQLWARNLGDPGNHYGHSSSLLVHENILLIQYDIKAAPKMMGLSISDGTTVWDMPRKVKVSWASPVLVNTGSRMEVIVVAEPNVTSYDPLTGKEYWSVNCLFGEVGPSVSYSDGLVFAVNEYASLVAIKLGDNPEVLWESDEYMSDVPSPVAINDLLFMATSYGVVLCYNANTGEIYWEQEYDNGFYSSPMLVDGKIYLMDMQGIMHIFKAEKEFTSIGESPIGESGMTSPAFADGKIYIRGNKHLFCIGK